MSTNTHTIFSPKFAFPMLAGAVILSAFFLISNGFSHDSMVTIEGTVEHEGKPLSGVKVFVNEGDADDFDAHQEQLYYEPTNKEGKYRLQFRADQPIEEITLVYAKEGFRTKHLPLDTSVKRKPTVLDFDVSLQLVIQEKNSIAFPTFTARH